MNQNKTLSLVGLAKRAGAVTLGEKQVLAAIKEESNPVVFLAKDAGDNIVKKIENKLHATPFTLCRDYTKSELSHAIGTTNSAVVLVNKEGFNEQLRMRLKS